MKKRSRIAICLVLIMALLAGCQKSSVQETTQAQGAQTEAGQAGQAGTNTQNAGNSIAEAVMQAQNAGENAAGTTAETAAQASAPLTNADRATFAFTRENFPTMDGSTATVPLGQAVASVLLGESPEAVTDLAEFHKTTQSFRNLKNGNCDILIVGEPNAAVFDEMKEEGFEYELEEIATDALIFVVNQNNPVENLTTEQIRDIYTGKITNWKEVGGNDAPIAAFQRNEGAGSQALMKKLVMKDTPLMEAPSTLVATEMGELMESVKSYDNSANAIGYSVYYYANDMKKAEGLKLLSVDGVEPEAETIRARKYPHLNAYYC